MHNKERNTVLKSTKSCYCIPLLLQYVYLMDKEGKILTCDESGRNFLKSIDFELFYSQLQSIKLNSAITNTTILLNNNSYNLRMVPIDIQSGHDNYASYQNSNIEYIIVLQDQTLFSYIFYRLNQQSHIFFKESQIDQTHLDEIFKYSSDGIFITNANGTVIYANSAYENATGLSLTDIIGRNISDLGVSGVFNPLITPTILKTRKALTTLQKLGTGKSAIISGTPIYNSSGQPIIIITCVNVITKISHANFPNQFYEPSDLKFNMNAQRKDQSIDIIAESRIMKTILQEAIKVARYDVTVLILGDSGVGKEVIASIIHASSQRNSENFVKINCSALSPALLESELFGYEAGSFTGALSKGKPGLFEIANRGTILLDEIGDMPIDLQAKLLRVLQSREFYRVGGLVPIATDVRIIASTNRNLEKMIEQGEFRRDLYYRLNVVSIYLPSLQDRKEDIKPLLFHFSYFYNKMYGTNKQFSDELIDTLKKYHWPGNIRELQNLVERLTVLCIEDLLLPEHFFSKYKPSKMAALSEEDIQINRIIPLKDAVSVVEKELVKKALELCKSTRAAAKLLGVSQSTVMRKIREENIAAPDI